MKHEITSQNTKRMLANTLISLMKKKPLSKISISEIVKECQINRKTFYYHFEDIYGLLEWHLEQEINSIINSRIANIYKCDNYISTETYIASLVAVGNKIGLVNEKGEMENVEKAGGQLILEPKKETVLVKGQKTSKKEPKTAPKKTKKA